MVGEQAGHGGHRWSVVATRASGLFGTESVVCDKCACLVHECTGVVGAVDGGLRLPHRLPALLHLRQLRELQHGTRTISRHKSNAVAMTIADQAAGRGERSSGEMRWHSGDRSGGGDMHRSTTVERNPWPLVRKRRGSDAAHYHTALLSVACHAGACLEMLHPLLAVFDMNAMPQCCLNGLPLSNSAGH